MTVQHEAMTQVHMTRVLSPTDRLPGRESKVSEIAEVAKNNL